MRWAWQPIAPLRPARWRRRNRSAGTRSCWCGTARLPPAARTISRSSDSSTHRRTGTGRSPAPATAAARPSPCGCGTSSPARRSCARHRAAAACASARTSARRTARKISAESAAKISVSSLVSGCRNVSLKVACAKMTANSRKVTMESAMTAGVRFFFVLLEGVTDGMNRLSSGMRSPDTPGVQAARGDSRGRCPL